LNDTGKKKPGDKNDPTTSLRHWKQAVKL